MYDPVAHAKSTIRSLIEGALKQAVRQEQLPDIPAPDFAVDIPADTAHGDFAVNIALTGARAFKKAPRDIAAILLANIQTDLLFRDVQIAGLGFLNFYLADSYFADVVAAALREGADFGRTDGNAGRKIMVEFVSANPTGPMHLGNARGGALGDCIAAALEYTGADVTREFYVNDAGNQIEKFAISLEARYLQIYQDGIEFPEDGYKGDDITAHAEAFAAIHGDRYVTLDSDVRKQALISYALPRNIEGLKRDLELYRIQYDVWFLESTLHADGSVEKVVGMLRDRGYTYEQDGALWYKATSFGSEKDEVLMRSNGFYTYFAVDIAYHYNKFIVRGFDHVINVWGADHHGHVARLKGAMDALGIGSDRLEVVLMQLVNLVRDGQPVRMSKRTGKAITLTDLLEEIPIDAARFYFNLREPSSHFDFDLDLAVKQSSDNPVFYVQYANARICSILKALAAGGIDTETGDANGLLLTTSEERALIRHIGMLPAEIAATARERDPAHITRYAIELATLFHRFYTNCRVKESEPQLRFARIALCKATRQAVQNCLALLKITAPESM